MWDLRKENRKREKRKEKEKEKNSVFLLGKRRGDPLVVVIILRLFCKMLNDP